MPSREQSVFIENWNKIANSLIKRNIFDPLPFLPKSGVCGGLVDHLIQCLSVDDEITYFKIYNFICDSEPDLVVDWIVEGYKTKRSIDKILDFIFNIYFLQTNQKKLPDCFSQTEFVPEKRLSMDEARNQLIDELNSNFIRIKGQNLDDYGHIFLEDTSSQINYQGMGKEWFRYHLDCKMKLMLNCMENESCFNLSFVKGTVGHAIFLYKKADNKWKIFDPIQGVLQQFNSKEMASKYLADRLIFLFEYKELQFNFDVMSDKIFTDAFLIYKHISLKNRLTATQISDSIKQNINPKKKEFNPSIKAPSIIGTIYEKFCLFRFKSNLDSSLKKDDLITRIEDINKCANDLKPPFA